MVARLQARRAAWIGDDADLLAIGAQDDNGALIVESLLEHDDVDLDLVPSGRDNIERVVEKPAPVPAVTTRP
jgi:hypothetical protein